MIAFVLISDCAESAYCYIFAIEEIPVKVVACVNVIEYCRLYIADFAYWAWACVEASVYLLSYAYLSGNFEARVVLATTLHAYVYIFCARFALQMSVLTE